MRVVNCEKALAGWGLAMMMLLVGCQGESPTAAPTSSQTDREASSGESAQAAKPTSPPIARDAQPAAVVSKFLDALRDGNQEISSALLTARALEETSKNNFSINNMAATGLECQVRQTEYPDQQTAEVSSYWKEGEGADAEEYEVVWVLRATAEGWRIAGMATAIFPGEPMVWFNFEDGEAFRQQMEQTDAEVVRREEAAAQQASRPGQVGQGAAPPR